MNRDTETRPRHTAGVPRIRGDEPQKCEDMILYG